MRENILRYILKATLSCIYYKYIIPWCKDLINYILKVVLWLHPVNQTYLIQGFVLFNQLIILSLKYNGRRIKSSNTTTTTNNGLFRNYLGHMDEYY